MTTSIETQQEIYKLKSQGWSSRYIASRLNIGKSTVNDVWNRMNKSEAEPSNTPRIMFFDLESAATIAATFGRFKTNIGHDNVIKEGGWLLSAAWKYKGDIDVSSVVCSSEEAIACNDERIVASLYDAFEQADIVVAHAANRFDIPLFRSRLALHGFNMHKSVKIIDTLQVARNMKFNSNKLDSLASYFNLEQKRQHEGINLWIRCQQGDEKALKELELYNVQDIVVLEQLYNKLKAYDRKPANLALYFDDNKHRCPACASAAVEPTANIVYTQVSAFTEMICLDCGHRSKQRSNINSKQKRSSLLLTV